jgi:lectin-like protein
MLASSVMDVGRPRLAIASAALAIFCVRCTLFIDTGGLAEPTDDAGDADRAPETSADANPNEGGDDAAAGDGPSDAGAVVWPANGHRYRVVVAPGELTWEDAKAQAIRLGGHLVTLTSSEENDFVFGLVLITQDAYNGDYGPWIGASQPPDAIEPDQGWGWVTGEPWSFTAWAPGFPDDDGDQDYAHYFSGKDRRATWQDGSPTGYARAFVVEFE